MTDNDFDAYQRTAMKSAVYGENISGLAYTTLGLAGEAGELANKVKKVFRDNLDKEGPAIKSQMLLELGDILWYAAAVAHELNTPLSEVIKLNIQKLEHRRETGTIRGSGDNR